MEEERISQLGKSETVIEQNIKSLKQLFPQVFTEDKINFSLLEDLLGEKIEDRKEYYELSWAGKSDARKELSKSTTATLTPLREKSVDFDTTQNLFIEGENLEVLRTLQKSYFGKIKMIYIDPPYNTGSDSFVYPDNYSETKKEYEKRIGKVDEEGYINKVELWKQNTKENGQYHSVWLSMMYSRLSYAHSLLSEDGVIFISIDDNEQANLKLLCDSIFGEENFLSQIVVETANGVFGTRASALNSKLVKTKDYVIVYEKQKSQKNFQPLYMPTNERYDSHYSIVIDKNNNRSSLVEYIKNNPEIKHFFDKYHLDVSINNINKIMQIDSDFNILFINNLSEIIYQDVDFSLKIPQEVEDIINNGSILKFKEYLIFKTNNGQGKIRQLINFKQSLRQTDDYFSEYRKAVAIGDLWEGFDNDMKNVAKEGSIYFDTPKPIRLIKQLIKWCNTKDNDIILDFFAGSCTTGHAVMELNKEDGGNRKFICIQMPEKTDTKSEAYKKGYEKISDIGAERLRRAGKRIKEEIEKDRKENDEKLLDKKEIKDIDTGFKYYRLTPSHFKVWQNDINENELGKQLDAFIDATKEGSVEEEMLYELILKSGFSLTTPIEKNSKGFYYIKEWQTCIALENFNKETIESIFELKPKEVITLDKFFKNNDSLLSNTRLEFKDKEIILTII